MNVSRFGRTAAQLIVSGVILFSLGCGGGRSGDPTVSKAATTSLAISDGSNNRVLTYNAPFSTDEGASVVLGQVDFTHQLSNQGTNIAANTLSGPGGLARDADGNLYVADAGNCRILRFQPPFTNNMSASLVIGQGEFNSPMYCYDNPSATASGLDVPSSVVVDSEGSLWVTDGNFSRVTEYKRPLSNGMAATLAIGQPDLETTYQCNGKNFGKGATYPAASASTLCAPSGATLDSNGNLWVADTLNQRVLEFVPPFSTGMAANLELGQPVATAFTSNDPNSGGISSRSLSCPNAVTFDAVGDLWVADTCNGRVLEFVPPFTIDMAASLVIGTPDFTSLGAQNNGSPTANTIYFPTGMTFDSGGNLVVQDDGSNRVLVFEPPFSNGMSATTVIGQPNMTIGSENQGVYNAPTASTLWGPAGVLTF